VLDPFTAKVDKLITPLAPFFVGQVMSRGDANPRISESKDVLGHGASTSGTEFSNGNDLFRGRAGLGARAVVDIAEFDQELALCVRDLV
jgi:hypothetical protein